MRRRDFIKKLSTLMAAVVAVPGMLVKESSRYLRFYRYTPSEIPALMGWGCWYGKTNVPLCEQFGTIRTFKIKELPATPGWKRYLKRTEDING